MERNYRHLDTRKRIHEADAPKYLYIQRHEKVLANVTFCRRDIHWYVRYFAFAPKLQAPGNKRSRSRNNSLDAELNAYFDERLDDGVDSFYAYIDLEMPKAYK